MRRRRGANGYWAEAAAASVAGRGIVTSATPPEATVSRTLTRSAKSRPKCSSGPEIADPIGLPAKLRLIDTAIARPNQAISVARWRSEKMATSTGPTASPTSERGDVHHAEVGGRQPAVRRGPRHHQARDGDHEALATLGVDAAEDQRRHHPAHALQGPGDADLGGAAVEVVQDQHRQGHDQDAGADVEDEGRHCDPAQGHVTEDVR